MFIFRLFGAIVVTNIFMIKGQIISTQNNFLSFDNLYRLLSEFLFMILRKKEKKNILIKGTEL